MLVWRYRKWGDYNSELLCVVLCTEAVHSQLDERFLQFSGLGFVTMVWSALAGVCCH